MENHIDIHAYSPTNYTFTASPTRFLDPLTTMFFPRYLTATTSAAATSAVDIDPPAIPSTISPFFSQPSLQSKRSFSQALYHPTILGTQKTIGQNEAWYSTNPLAKRPRYESGSNLPIYAQRPGEEDCAHYMLTRTCMFGESCKFDHPIWVPEGGIPDWKEVPEVVTNETLPERPGEPDCPYFVKTQRCKFGPRCKFNHPTVSSESVGVSGLPERPSEPPCAFYVKTGRCKFGAACKFHHPKDIQIQLSDDLSHTAQQTQTGFMMKGATVDTQTIKPLMSPLFQNSKGLPVRLEEVDCPFYMKTGSCKYGASCRYNHPDRTVAPSALTSSAAYLNIGAINPSTTVYQTFDPRLSNPMSQVGMAETIYPQRPGQIECDYYMKNGVCKFLERCKFHHPIDRSAPLQQTVKLTPAGLPRRQGAEICPYYLKTGTCKYGATCKFDHPPPGEVMEMAKLQVTSTTNENISGAAQ
ncbi:PREDICTED: zinc finger CCCH domain-containing protein 37-like isoform X2 [Lupinus angustifolius]|uniref:zinc finger CCCH domain-containing protein 37-like isoform X2 n=1 Tax=Lupinus angustifolius TaxID=3871 RepID=UPI00092FC250|nr:PREDICTED: zinc finger CCCH domain-containing protein 37-like isoform X2 [Lupinus angustifolius]